MSSRPKRSLRVSAASVPNEPENIEDIVTNCVERMITGLEITENYDRTVREIYLAQRKLIDKPIPQILKESDWIANAHKSRLEHPILPLSKRKLIETSDDEDGGNGEGPSSPIEKKSKNKKGSSSKAKTPERPKHPPKEQSPPQIEPKLEIEKELEENDDDKNFSSVPPKLEEETEKRECSEPPSTPMQLECHLLQPENLEEQEQPAE